MSLVRIAWYRAFEIAVLIALAAEFIRMRAIVLFTTGTDIAVRMAAIAIPISSSGKLRPEHACSALSDFFELMAISAYASAGERCTRSSVVCLWKT